jgi:hypothetical protein
MASFAQFRPRAEIGREAWDAFVESSEECWLWHRWDLIEALSSWPGRHDISFALVDQKGRLLAIVPLHAARARAAGVISFVRLDSLGGPACAAVPNRRKVFAALAEEVSRLMSVNNALATEAQIAPLTPCLNGPAAPKVNPLLHAGFMNTQTETWIVNLADDPEEIRRKYSESTRQELRKALSLDYVLREASGAKDIDTYYRLHLETYARTGATPHPVEYFKSIFEKFQQKRMARILFVERRGEVVAAQNTGLYKRGAVYWTGASLSNKDGGENRILMDAQVMAARMDGCERYETGQAFVNAGNHKETGLSHFKRSFGAELYPFYRGVMRSPRPAFCMLWGLHEARQAISRARA